MKHDYCARCGADAKETRRLRTWCGERSSWFGNHIWTWDEGDSIIPFPDRTELIEAKRAKP